MQFIGNKNTVSINDLLFDIQLSDRLWSFSVFLQPLLGLYFKRFSNRSKTPSNQLLEMSLNHANNINEKV